MEAIEFQTKIKNGTIEIPDMYQPDLTEDAQVKVIVLKQPRSQLIRAFRALLKETQALPEAQAITEAEIADEIDAYRAGQ